MRRFFSSSGSRTASPSFKSKNVRLTINIPSYGCVFMNCDPGGSGVLPNDAYMVPPGDPDYTIGRDLSGELEVEVPRGMGPRRCRAIRVTLKSVCKLNMGPERGWEEDVLFERQVEVKGAIILHEGVQRWVLVHRETTHD